MKRCCACKHDKPTTEFYACRSHKDGLASRCKKCSLRIAKAWAQANQEHRRVRDHARYLENIDRVRDYGRAWRERNKERKAENDRVYGLNNRDRRNAISRAWDARHPLKAKTVKINSSAKVRGAIGDVTPQQWRDILAFYGHACARCGTQTAGRSLAVDHYRPISKGGIHHWANIWPVCLSCNSQKNNHVFPGAPPHVVAFLLEAA